MSRKRRSGKKKSPKPKRPPKVGQRSARGSKISTQETVDAALSRIYPELSPLFFEPGKPIAGPDPLQGIRAQPVEEPTPHWHLVTYGLSQTYGFELTLRVKDDGEEVGPPNWAMLLLNTLTMFVADVGRAIEPGQRVNLNGPLSFERATQLRAAAFIADPTLETYETPKGSLKFVQIVGLSGPELEAGSSWDMAKLLELLLERIPVGLTDLERECLLKTDPELRAQVEAKIAEEGSTEEAVNLDAVRWSLEDEKLSVTLGAGGVTLVQGLLRGRTRHGREFQIFDPEHQLTIASGETLAWTADPEDKNHLTLTLPEAEVARLLEEVKPQRGLHELGGWSLRIVPTQILDENDRVFETIG